MKIIVILLIGLAVSCSVSDENKSFEPEFEEIQTNTSFTSEQDNDLDGDFIPDDIEENLGLSKEIADVPVISSDVGKSVVVGKNYIYELKSSSYSVLNQNHKLLSLGRGSVGDHQYLKNALVFEATKKSEVSKFETNSYCENDCYLYIDTLLKVSESYYLKNYKSFEISIRYFDTLNNTLKEIDRRVVVDKLGDPVSMKLETDSGQLLDYISQKIKVPEDVVRSLITGDYYLVVGISNVSFEIDGEIRTYSELLQSKSLKSKTVSIVLNDKIFEYSSSNTKIILDKLFNAKNMNIKMNGDNIYSVQYRMNTMGEWKNLNDIDSDEYLNGIWKINSEGLSRDGIRESNYYLSYITNSDRFNLQNKRFVEYEEIASDYDLPSLRPSEEVSLKLSKEYKRYREKHSNALFKSVRLSKGERSCFEYKERRISQDCDFDTRKGRCDIVEKVCVDWDITVGSSSYSCHVTNSTVESYIDYSSLLDASSLVVENDGEMSALENVFTYEKSLDNGSYILKLKEDANNIRISNRNKSVSLMSGYVKDTCLKKQCPNDSRFRYDCIHKVPIRNNSTRQSYIEENRLRIKTIKKEIIYDDY